MTYITPEEEPLPVELPEQFAELMRRMQAESAALDLEAEASAAESAAARAAQAEQARSGELGPDWVAVQNRIDLNQTSLEAVFSGEDTSKEATNLRDLSQKNLAELREQWQAIEEDEENEDEPTPLEALNSLSAESRVRYQAAAEQIAAVLEQSGLNNFREQS